MEPAVAGLLDQCLATACSIDAKGYFLFLKFLELKKYKNESIHYFYTPVSACSYQLENDCKQ